MNYSPPPHVTQNWLLTKPSAAGKRGMVVSQARSATEAGVAILDAGGNAIDAAVATALALPTVEPWNSGLGGIGFALVHRAGQARADVVDFGPVAPRRLSPSAFKLTGRLTNSQSQPIADATLDVLQQIAGTSTLTLIAHTTTRPRALSSTR